MALLDPGLLPYVDACLFLMSLFLNGLWLGLLRQWYRASGRFPSPVLVGAAAVAWVIVLGACVAAFPPTHWLLGFALANGAFISVLDPALAVCFTLSMLMMRPWEIMEPNPVILLVPKFSTIFSFGWALFYLVWNDGFRPRLPRMFKLFLVYYAWLWLSTFVTPDPSSTREALFAVLFPTLTLVFLVCHLSRNRFASWAFKHSLITVLACVAFISIYFFVNGYRVTGRIVAFGSFTNSNDIAAIMCILLPLAACAFLEARKMSAKLYAAFAFSVAFIVMALAQSRGAVIAIVVGLAAYAFQRLRNKKVAVVMVVVMALGGLVATKLFTRDKGDLGGSTSNRRIFWVSGIRMALFNPVFGVGFNEFPANVEAYATETPEERGHHTAHSAWILALAESGPVGLALFLSIFYLGILKPAYRLRFADQSWFYVGVMYATAICFLSHTYLIFPYLIGAIVTVTLRAYPRSRLVARRASGRVALPRALRRAS